MREKPILFSGPMVRAILDGTKTQTRRVLKTQPPLLGRIRHAWFNAPIYGFTDEDIPAASWWKIKCPYGQPGDRLWVRETWGTGSRPHPIRGTDEGIEYRADQYFVDEIESLPLCTECVPADFELDSVPSGWRPSIFMPRWASRITLEVTGVRVEQLQDIGEADARAEGAKSMDIVTGRQTLDPDSRQGSYVAHYREIWDSINAKTAPWASNPWVWVVEFKRLGK